MSLTEILHLPRVEKVKLMEAIWADLSRDEADLESPVWHFEELARTEERLNAGKEEILDWSDAKKELRTLLG